MSTMQLTTIMDLIICQHLAFYSAK